MCRFYCQCLFRTWSRTTLLWLALILCDLMPVPTPWRKKKMKLEILIFIMSLIKMIFHMRVKFPKFLKINNNYDFMLCTCVLMRQNKNSITV